MSSHSSSRSRRKKKQDREFTRTGKKPITLPIFIITLVTLIVLAAMWAATRDRSRAITVDASSGGKRSIAEVEASKSWKRLEAAGVEIQQRISGQQPKDVRDLLKIYKAVGDRQLQVAANDKQKDAAYSKQMSALQGLAKSETDSEARLRLSTELSALALKLREHEDEELASRAFQSLFMASEMILSDGVNDEEDSKRLSDLLRSWVGQAATRFPSDRAICESIGSLFSRFPSVSGRDEQLEGLAEAIKQGYGKSPNPAVVEWAGSVEVKQFFDENKVLNRLSAALSQTKLQTEQLQDLEDQLLADKPAIGRLQFAVQLAQVYEGFEQVEAMQGLLDRMAAADLSEISEEKRAELKVNSEKMRERQSLRGQNLDMDLVLRDGARFTKEQINNQIAVLIFFSSPNEIENLSSELGVFERLPKKEFHYFLVGPEVEESEWIRLSGLVNARDPEFRLPLVSPAEVEQLRDKFRITSTVYSVALNRGRINFLATPLNRLLIWLESQLFGK